MVIDTSAIVAILHQEPEAQVLARAIENDPVHLMSTATFLETCIVIESRHGEPGGRELDLLIARSEIKLEPVTPEQAEVARRCYHKYGKGHHGAALNYGDCFSYALSRTTGEPLLCKGNDFKQTDLPLVLI
jgi:ribonuclease VapC